MSDSKDRDCHLTFGLITDIQYADTDDGTNCFGTRKRYYRGALNHLENTVTNWKQTYADLAFVVDLGDLIDGWNKRRGGNEAAVTALETVLKPFRSLSCPTYHMTGNHDFYNFTRKQFLGLEPSGSLPEKEQISYLHGAARSDFRQATCEGEAFCDASKEAGSEEERTCISRKAAYVASEVNSSTLPGVSGVKDELYYSVIVHPQLRIIVLDTYDISALGFEDWPENSNFKLATAMLEKENPEPEKNSSPQQQGEAKSFVFDYNGGLGKRQLEWLDLQLSEAETMKQNVIICGHIQIVPHPGVAMTCIWNYQEVFDVIHAHKCVILCLAGHDHDGSLTVDSTGLPHLVLKGVLETPPNNSAFATAFLHSNRLEIWGSGFVPSLTVYLKYPVSSC